MSEQALWEHVVTAALADEKCCVDNLITILDTAPEQQSAVARQAAAWISEARRHPPQGIEALLLEYPLSQPEGIALMCLAEALLRIPNADVADELIRDVLNPLVWERHLGHSESWFVNAASYGLALTGRWLAATQHPEGQANTWLRQLANKLGEPMLRQALKQAMRYLAEQFVLGENLTVALRRADNNRQPGITYSFDMLGEAALTASDSTQYFAAYSEAIQQVSDSFSDRPEIIRPSVSIKLSALHPRYHAAQSQRLQAELIPKLLSLARSAASANLDLCIDAEEADRLELSLQIFASVLQTLDEQQRPHFGLAMQAYSKRALPTLQWLRVVAARCQTRINIRLVKGAYWDTEIKRAQQRGLSSYPVFTDKCATDLSYLACAKWLLQHPQEFFPQFATHNATTVAALLTLQPDSSRFELQRLQGMGEALYRIVCAQHPQLRVRVYAPVGEHRDLLPYLIRRLLENGANTSFIHQLHEPSIRIADLAAHPSQQITIDNIGSNLPLPPDLWLPQRKNAPGIYWCSEAERESFLSALNVWRDYRYDFTAVGGEQFVTRNPFSYQPVGTWSTADIADCNAAIAQAKKQQFEWRTVSIAQRAKIIEQCAELFIAHRAELIALIIRETGKTLENANEELREAVDFCRYYASTARLQLCEQALPSVTGEENRLQLCARGIFLAISPWNFPLAIFTGQIVAALVTGNAVIAKPAEQATLTAMRAIELMHSAGVSRQLLQCLPGPGEIIGRHLCGHVDIDGIVFTGGFDTARSIQRELTNRAGAIIPFIAETAGINVLIVDSTAQPQQLTLDVIRSAFDSAGQRCSALRVLCLPHSIADDIENLLAGAMQQLQLGDPFEWSTDIGPVINTDAKIELLAYLDQHSTDILFQCPSPNSGDFVPLTLVRIQHIKQMEREAFGPILHVLRYQESATETLIEQINSLGFGLTCGIHSRNLSKAIALAEQLQVGNIYINRDIIGATVGAQPFGGTGKSGTGPKAGGPHYLLRFTTEKTLTINTAALGGDYTLLTK